MTNKRTKYEKNGFWNKIKVISNQFSHEIRNTFLKYPCTIISIVILTLLETVFMDTSQEILEEFAVPFLLFLCVGFFFGESVFQGSAIWKALSLTLITAASIMMAYGIFIHRDDILPDDAWLMRIIIAYSAVLLICGIYICYKRSGYSLPQYVIKVFANLIKTHIVYIILMIGVMIVCGIIYELFINDYNFTIYGRLMILVTGFFYIPSWIYAVSQVESKVEKFARIVVQYVLLPLTVLIFIIIYVYLLKILILRDIPSNQIFPILTGLFLMGMPTWTMMEAAEQQTIWKKTAEKLPILFVPLVLLQIYSVGIRIKEFGVTPERYLGVMWVVLEIIYFIIHWKKKWLAGNMMLVGAGAVVILLLIPFFNMYHISVISQQAILSQYKKATNFSEEMKKKIYGAYDYLSEVSGGKEYIDDNYTKDEIKEIAGFYEEGIDGNLSNKIYVSIESEKNNINVQNFSRMKVVEYHNEYGDFPPNLNRLIFTEYGTDYEAAVIDAEHTIKQYIDYGLEKSSRDENSVDIDSYYLEHCEIEVDEDTVLIISNFNITYDKQSEEVEYLYIKGYLLFRGEE